jgi:D-cysteine desulfhydrase
MVEEAAQPSRLEALAPGLAGQRVPLGRWPTPVHPIDVDGGVLWVKDEGAAADAYGGNKVRKLEWLLGAMRERSTVVAVGAVGSNHVHATAVHGAGLGLKVSAVLVPQPDLPSVRRAAAANAALLHRVWPARNEAAAAGRLAAAVIAAWREDGRRPGVMWIGGSTPRGVLGWVDGALELAAQVREGALPEPARIVVPAGSGGIAAGLLVGLDLAGLRSVVQAVRVADPLIVSRRVVLAYARAAARLLRRAGGPRVELDERRLVLDPRWLGAGYGEPTVAAAQVTPLAAAAGLAVEPTYSAKALAAAVAALREGRPGPVLWIATANRQPVPAALAAAPLPEAMARLLRPPSGDGPTR